MKKMIFSAALLMGLAVVSFAGNPKEDKTTPTENATETKAGQQLYWYKVSYATNPNGVIPPGADLEAYDTQENAEGLSICDPGSERDCLRGFTAEQSSGTASLGQAQIKTDEQP